MGKICVRDVINARHTLKRLQNYADRHMDNVEIAEANENVAEARKLLSDNLNNFDGMDVTELTRDTTETRENLEYWNGNLTRLKCERKRLKKEIKAETDKDEKGYLKEDLEWLQKDIAETRDRIETLENQL